MRSSERSKRRRSVSSCSARPNSRAKPTSPIAKGPPPGGEELGQSDHRAGEERQLLPDILELFDDARHDKDHQRHHDEACHDRQNDGVGERGSDLGTNLGLALLEVGSRSRMRGKVPDPSPAATMAR
jgi:hypothetical protein